MNTHEHILIRLTEELSLAPNPGVGTMSGDTSSGQNSRLTTPAKNNVELKRDVKPNHELKIADAILKAASGLAKSAASEEIIRQAKELKRMHGIK